MQFQSHAGSIEARVMRRKEFVLSSFQSHAGSIEAAQKSATVFQIPPVSIPRWFD